VTNAHVVAGSSSVEIDTPNGIRHAARVVLFDPNTDLAVLYSPGLSLRPLVILDKTPVRGNGGAVIGYPGGGAEQVVSAVVSSTESATGYNIYGDTLVTRELEVLAARVIPGNSGGPIVNDAGQIIGVVFAASTNQSDVGYALTMPQVYPDLQAGEHRTAAVSTQACAS
jgi:S1-C subfamily serine protease